jgi:hypothetical protein
MRDVEEVADEVKFGKRGGPAHLLVLQWSLIQLSDISVSQISMFDMCHHQFNKHERYDGSQEQSYLRSRRERLESETVAQ